MSFLSSLMSTKAKAIGDTAIKAYTNADPDGAGAAQLDVWDSEAKGLAAIASSAASDMKIAADAVANIQKQVARFTAAAEQLAVTNPTVANTAADSALDWQSRLAGAVSALDSATKWAAETTASAVAAEQRVANGRAKIEAAKRDQLEANHEATIAAQRLHDRERMAGINTGISGADAALDAMTANTKALHEKAVADNLRAGVLGQATDSEAVITAAMAEVDGSSAPKTLADKLAALKSV